ncbi:MAG: hypothetical protein K6G80_04010 [Treponema sp.]|nr:hypothetical protein [Treponema sp.]
MKKTTCGIAAALLACGLAVTGCASTDAAGKAASVDTTKSSNLTFVFGTKAKGGIAVSNQVYSDKAGYGFKDADVKASAFAVTADSSLMFKAKVANGNYSVTVSTDATKVFAETAEGLSDMTHNARIPKNPTETFQVAVCDGVLDLTFEEPANVKKITINAIAPKAKNAKPAIYAIGDSTTKNTANGANSWGNCVANKWVKLPESFSAFYNHGMAGRDSIQFYNQARLEAVLLAVAPGDYVTINMGINSRGDGEIESYPALMANYYVEGVIQRGGIPVILTRTPDGPVRGSEADNWAGDYDVAAKKFTNRGAGGNADDARNGELRKIAAAKKLAVIEVGQYGEDLFNTFDAAYVKKYNEDHGTKFATPIEMVQSWYLDHNHYRAELGNIIGAYILDSLDKIAKNAK